MLHKNTVLNNQKNITLNIQASDAVLKPELFEQLKRCIQDKHYRLRIKEFYWEKSRNALTVRKVECGMTGAFAPLQSKTALQMIYDFMLSRYTYSIDVNVNVKQPKARCFRSAHVSAHKNLEK